MEECQEVVEGTNTTTAFLAESPTARKDPTVVLDSYKATSLVLLCLVGLYVLSLVFSGSSSPKTLR